MRIFFTFSHPTDGSLSCSSIRQYPQSNLTEPDAYFHPVSYGIITQNAPKCLSAFCSSILGQPFYSAFICLQTLSQSCMTDCLFCLFLTVSFLVMEQSNTSEGHSHTILIAGGNHIFIPDRSTRLCNIFYSALMSPLNIV